MKPAPLPPTLDLAEALVAACDRSRAGDHRRCAGDGLRFEQKADPSPVTEADRAAEAVDPRASRRDRAGRAGDRRGGLRRRPRPERRATNSSSSTPLDGTKEFVQRRQRFHRQHRPHPRRRPGDRAWSSPRRPAGFYVGVAGKGAWAARVVNGAGRERRAIHVAPAADGPIDVVASRSHRTPGDRRLYRPLRGRRAGLGRLVAEILHGGGGQGRPLSAHGHDHAVGHRGRRRSLRRLEAEAIFIMREVVATFERPVMLYSIGKDSSVMLHLARKAFYPAPPPFPLLHVDTTWKFREMIRFRDETAKKYHLDLRVHTNQDGVARGINPFDHGSSLYTQVMKTEALKQALDRRPLRRRLRRRAPRRGEEPRQGAHLLVPLRRATAGTRRTSGRSSGRSTTRASSRASRSASSRCRTGPSSTSGNTSSPRTSRSCRSISPPSGRWSNRDGQLIMVDDERMPLQPGEVPEKRVRFRTLGCYPLTAAIEIGRRDACRDRRRDVRRPHLRAPGPPDRPRRGRLDGDEEARGLFLMAHRPEQPGGLRRLPRRRTRARACCAS